MKTNFYSSTTNDFVAGESIAKVIFYNAGAELGFVNEITEHTITNNKISSVYDGTANNVYINGSIKRANKLNLERKDNFYIKNPDSRYAFDPAYVLYINTNNIIFQIVGDVLAIETDHEKNYLLTYKVTFKNVDFIRNIIERVPCENYTLQNNETWSDGYGCDREHAAIDTYTISENGYISRKNPDRIGESGIIRKYRKTETVANCEMILTKPYYTKCIKDDFRINAERISEAATAAGVKLSRYDIERLINAGFTISCNQ